MDTSTAMLPNTAQIVDASGTGPAQSVGGSVSSASTTTDTATTSEPKPKLKRISGSNFQGDHGAYFAVLTFVALVLSLVATLSFSSTPKLSLATLKIAATGTNAEGKLRLAVWGWSSSGAHSIVSKVRPIGSSWATMFKDLPEEWGQIAGAVQRVSKPLVVTMGVIPILANIDLFFGFVTAALSSYYFARESYMCHQMAVASTIFTGVASMWCLISFALFFAVDAQLNKGLEEMQLTRSVQARMGPVTWLMMSAWLVSFYPVVARLAWHVDERTGTWTPPTWFTLTKDGPAPAPMLRSWGLPVAPAVGAISSKAAEAKEEEHWCELSGAKNDSDELPGPPAPPYTEAQAGRKEELIV